MNFQQSGLNLKTTLTTERKKNLSDEEDKEEKSNKSKQRTNIKKATKRKVREDEGDEDEKRDKRKKLKEKAEEKEGSEEGSEKGSGESDSMDVEDNGKKETRGKKEEEEGNIEEPEDEETIKKRIRLFETSDCWTLDALRIFRSFQDSPKKILVFNLYKKYMETYLKRRDNKKKLTQQEKDILSARFLQVTMELQIHGFLHAVKKKDFAEKLC